MKIEKLEYYTGGTTHRDGSLSWERHPNNDDIVNKINEIIDKLNEWDSIEPIKHGKWVRKEDEYAYWYECSECGAYPLYEHGVRVFSRDCPNCGAHMDKGEADT